MARGKYERPSQAKSKKSLVSITALVLIMSCAVCGSIAWLISTPEPVVNTFTYGDIIITLEETDTGLDSDGNRNTNMYKMFPDQRILKDPVVTVKAGSEDLWLFVKLEKSSNFDTFMEYIVDSSWEDLTGVSGVYYRQVSAAEVAYADQAMNILANNTVTVKKSVTREMLNALDEDPENVTYPTLSISAYAIQKAGSDSAADAWVKVNAQTP